VRGGQKRNESIQKPPDPNVNCKSASSIVPESGPAQLRTQSLRKKAIMRRIVTVETATTVRRQVPSPRRLGHAAHTRDYLT
jgi:hypothetical protein